MIPLLIFLAVAAVALHAFWAQKRGRFDPILLIGDAGVAVALLILVVEGSSFFLNYSWWKELGQEQTFWQYVRIRWEPQAAAVVLGFIVLAVGLRLGRRHSLTALPRTRLFSWLGHAAALVVSFFLAENLIDPWRVALWLGSRDTGLYRDPLFGHSLTFYLFQLPFYRMIFAWVGLLLVLALVFYGVTVGLGASGERLDALREKLEARECGLRIAPRTAGPMLADFAGLARVGGVGHNTSGDLFLAFATGNHIPARADGLIPLRGMIPHNQLNSFVDAVAEAVEEAILNSLTAAETMAGVQVRTAYALPLDELQRIMAKYR